MSTHRWNEQLLRGANLGDVGLMQEALQHGADVNTKDTKDCYRKTPFGYASWKGKLEAAQYLSGVKGVDLNAVNRDGYSAFHSACAVGNLEMVQFLANLPGFNLINATTNSGCTALHVAVVPGRLAVIRYLLSSNLGFDVETRDGRGWTALLAACHSLRYRNHSEDLVEVVRMLLENGAQINARDSNGMTPLHAAADWHTSVVIRELLQHGADLLAVDDYGHTPFDRASTNNISHPQTSNYIITSSYNNLLVARHGNQAIHAALEVAQYRCVVQQYPRRRTLLRVQLPVGTLAFDQFRALLQSFDINFLRQRNNNGAIPFHVACRTAAPVEILDLLLQEFPGALRIADNSGSLPIHVACQANAPSLAAVRARDHTGALPLHRLCSSNPAVNTVELVVNAHEGSLSARTNSGDLPFTGACKTGASLSVVYRLLRAYPDVLENMSTVGELTVKKGVPSVTDEYSKKLEQKHKLEVAELEHKAAVYKRQRNEAKAEQAEEGEQLEQKAHGYKQQRDEANQRN